MSGRWLQRKGPGSAAYALLLLLSSAGHAAWAAPTDNIVYQTPSIFDPHSGPALLIHHLSLFVMQITGAIFIVVASLLAYVVVRFRQRDPNDDSEPPQIYGSTQIELAWTVIPILIVFVLFLTTARILFAIQDQKMPPSALDVDVVGHQFWWEFRYAKLGFTTANELHVPLSTEQAPMITSLSLLSADVDHSFWVPALFGKIDSIPNQVNHMWFNPDKARHVRGPMCPVLRRGTCQDAAACLRADPGRFRCLGEESAAAGGSGSGSCRRAGSFSSRRLASVATWCAAPPPRESLGQTLPTL